MQPDHTSSAANVGWLRLLGRRVYYHTFIGWPGSGCWSIVADRERTVHP